MLFHPRLPDGCRAPLPWPIKIIRFNPAVWPLAERAPKWLRLAQFTYTLISFVLLSYIDYSNFLYICRWYPDINEIVSIAPAVLALMEIHMRVYHMAAHKDQFKHFMENFYKTAYVQESLFPKVFRSIRLKSLPAIYYSISYVLTYCFYGNALVMAWAHGERSLMFKQAYHYDYTVLPLYLLHLAANFWVGLLVISQFFGETNILTTCILHLNGRYQILQAEMDDFTEQLLASNIDSASIAFEFKKGISKFTKSVAALNDIVFEMEQTFTVRIFILFSFSSIAVCTLLYNVLAIGVTWENAQFLVWILAKLSELFVIGELGSSLIKTTNNISAACYQSRWDEVIERSSDSGENVRLMKFVLLAMQVNNRPLSLTGLKFFTVALQSVMAVIQGGFSYFTFLHNVK